MFFFLTIHTAVANTNPDEFYGVEEKTGNFLPEKLWFYNEDSIIVNISSLIKKPTLITFNYYNCPDLCTPLLEGVAELVNKTGLDIGKDYQIFTISIDETEGPYLARNKKETILAKINNYNEAANNWKFFTGNKENIQLITETTGWKFKRNGDGFIHPAVVLLITPKRMISQYLYGTFFNPVHFQLGVTGAWNEQTSAPRIETLKYCYNYERKANVYSRPFTIIAGIAIIASIIIFFMILIYKPVKRYH